MDIPDLTRIVEMHVRVEDLEPGPYLDQLRRDVSPHLRRLHAEGRVRWFSFLLHTTQQLTPPRDEEGYIVHIRLEPASNLQLETFVKTLPPHFIDPHVVPTLSAISGLDEAALKDGDWAHAWKLFGECSAWVLGLLDAYSSGPLPGDTVQFLHFMTNPLMLGGKSVFLPHSQTF